MGCSCHATNANQSQFLIFYVVVNSISVDSRAKVTGYENTEAQ